MTRYLSMKGAQRCQDNGVEAGCKGQEVFLDESLYNVPLPEKADAR